MKTLKLGLFENAQTNAGGTATWRHEDSERHMFDTLDYWQKVAKICEDAKFDFLFLADAWGWSEVRGTRPAIASEETLDLPRLDPAIVVASLLSTTKDLGLVVTGSVLVEPPYAFARRMATLDQLSQGRLGWNIVTTGTADTAVKAFGMDMVAHDERYAMAEDFLELVYKYWEGAWEPDALEKDKQGRFADPDKVHLIKHAGKYFHSEGYGNTAYSPQGTPVLFQAGASPAGRRVAGRHGEAIFVGSGTAEQLLGHTTAIRAEAVNAGRGRDDVKIMSAMSCVVGATTSDAERRYQRILDAQRPEVTVASYAMFTGIDLSSYSHDTPMSELSTEISQTQLARFAGKTVGDVLRDWHTHGVGAKPVVGTAEEIADHICSLAEEADLDGFLLSPSVQLSSTTDFIESVLPILRKRGAIATEYREGESLRERLTGSSQPTLPANHPAAAYRHHTVAS